MIKHGRVMIKNGRVMIKNERVMAKHGRVESHDKILKSHDKKIGRVMLKNERRGCRKCAFSFFRCFIFLYFILAVALSNLREPKNSPPVKTDPAAPVNCKVVEIDDADPGAAAPPSLVEVPGWGNINTPPPPQDSWQPPPQDSWQPSSSSSSWDHRDHSSSSATQKVVYIFNCQNADCNQAVNS